MTDDDLPDRLFDGTPLAGLELTLDRAGWTFDAGAILSMIGAAVYWWGQGAQYGQAPVQRSVAIAPIALMVVGYVGLLAAEQHHNQQTSDQP